MTDLPVDHSDDSSPRRPALKRQNPSSTSDPLPIPISDTISTDSNDSLLSLSKPSIVASDSLDSHVKTHDSSALPSSLPLSLASSLASSLPLPSSTPSLPLPSPTPPLHPSSPPLPQDCSSSLVPCVSPPEPSATAAELAQQSLEHPVLDGRLEEVSMGLPAIKLQLLQLTRSHSASVIAAISLFFQQHADPGAPELLRPVRDMAHDIKGSSRNVGFMRLGFLCQLLENAASRGHFRTAMQLSELLAKHWEEVLQLITTLEASCSDDSPIRHPKRFRNT